MFTSTCRWSLKNRFVVHFSFNLTEKLEGLLNMVLAYNYRLRCVWVQNWSKMVQLEFKHKFLASLGSNPKSKQPDTFLPLFLVIALKLRERCKIFIIKLCSQIICNCMMDEGFNINLVVAKVNFLQTLYLIICNPLLKDPMHLDSGY